MSEGLAGVFSVISSYLKRTYLANPVNIVSMIVSAIVASVTSYIGGMSEFTRCALISLGVVVVCDTILGTIVALKNKTYTNKAVMAGVLKLFVYAISLTAMAPISTLISHIGVTSDPYILVSILAVYLAIQEAISVTKNSERLGVEWPKPVAELLDSIVDDINSTQIWRRDDKEEHCPDVDNAKEQRAEQ